MNVFFFFFTPSLWLVYHGTPHLRNSCSLIFRIFLWWLFFPSIKFFFSNWEFSLFKSSILNTNFKKIFNPIFHLFIFLLYLLRNCLDFIFQLFYLGVFFIIISATLDKVFINLEKCFSQGYFCITFSQWRAQYYKNFWRHFCWELMYAHRFLNN